MEPAHLLLIDDHALFRSGLRMVLESGLPRASITEAGSLVDAMAVEGPSPSLLLLDVQLPGLNGLDGLALLQRKWPSVPVVVLSSHSEPETIRKAIAHGARAFVSKAETADRILDVIRGILGATTDAFDCALPVPADGSASAGGDSARLTARQCEVLELLCQGLSNRLIGRRLGLSENTVRGHVQAILGILDVSSRSEATFVARRDGLVR